MVRETLDIALNLLVPLLCLIIPGIHAYKTGRFVPCVAMTWAALVLFEVGSLLLGGLVYHFSPLYNGLFEQGPGIFVMLMVGWFPGIVVSALSLMIRFAVIRIRLGLRLK